MKLKKLISVFLAAIMAVTAVVCCTVGASAATSAYDLIRTLKKHAVTAKSKLDSSITYDCVWEANDLYITISGLPGSASKKIAALIKKGNVLSLSFGTDNLFHVVFEDKQQMMNIKRPNLDEEFFQPQINLEYFTASGSTYKLSIKLELSKFYSILPSLKSIVGNSRAAALSISALNTSTGKRTYLGGKDFRYITYAKEQTGKVNLSKAKVTIAKQTAYTGSKVTVEPTVKVGVTKLVKNRDYTLTYKNNKDIGTATVIIKGKGNYTGSKKAYFKIVPKRPEFKDVDIVGRKVTLSWSPVEGADRYYLYVSSAKYYRVVEGNVVFKDDILGNDYELVKTLDRYTTTFTANIVDGYAYIYKVCAAKKVNGKIYVSRDSNVTRNIFIR